MPASPSRADTSPSCMTPRPESVGSSSCRHRTPPASRWYWSALRRIPARWPGLPSSVKPSAPASRSSAISVSASPAEAAGDRGQEADRHARLAPRLLAQREQDRRRVDGRVGVGHRDHGDVAAGRGRAGAGVEVLLVLLPGRAQVHVRVDEAGEQVPALAVDHLGAGRPGGRARRARRSPRRARARRVERRCPRAGRARGRRGPAGRRAPWAATRASRRHRSRGVRTAAGAARPPAARRAPPSAPPRRPRPAGR